MIPNEIPQKVETAGDGVKVVGNFKITDKTQARILVSLSDKMYTRKELAFIREYSTNAADAHLVAKRPISEILVDLPTIDNLVFKIRDFGSGLTEEQISNVYCVFGESTKRNSAEQNGLLGYGCKAGFAHADSFTVTSWINGEKSIYQCVKGDSTKLHSAILLSRTKSDEPSGLEICIPVKQSSLWTVHREAENFYKHWPELPTIRNLNNDSMERMTKFRTVQATLIGDGWEIRPRSDGSSQAVAYMGWVPYNIDWNVFSSRLALDSRKRVLFELIRNNDVILHFKMGEVNFVDSRESLEYTDLTLKTMVTRLEEIFKRIKDALQEKFDAAPNLWEAKKTYTYIFGKTSDLAEDEDETFGEKIKILDGDLHNLETTFRGEFHWKSIAIDSPDFEDLNRFDNKETDQIFDKEHSPDLPVMLSFHRKSGRASRLRCTAVFGNFIRARNSSVIVINDIQSKSGHSIVARYLMFNKDSKMRKVHILTFADQTIQDNFYSTYNFETVPVLKLSELIPTAKKWQAENKVNRETNGSASVREMNYLDIQSGTVEVNDVALRDIEEGGFYIEQYKGTRKKKVILNDGSVSRASSVVANLSKLIQLLDLDVDRVFIINDQIKQKKWFEKASAAGNWVNIWSHIKDNLDSLDVDALVKANAYSDASTLSYEVAKRLKKQLKNANSPMHQIIELSMVKVGNDDLALAQQLQEFEYWNEVVKNKKCKIDFDEIEKIMNANYPLASVYRFNSSAQDYQHLVKYINAMDCYVELSDEPKEVLKTA